MRPPARGPAVLVKSAPGRLGNQIIPIASVYSYALASGRRFVNLTFERYLEHFPALRAHSPAGMRCAVSRRVASVRCKLPMGATVVKATSAGPDSRTPKPFTALAPSGPIPGAEPRGPVYFRGWRLANPAGYERHRGEIRALLLPGAGVRRSVDAFASSWPRGRLIVAVHVRMTDFRTYRNGDLLVPIEGYRDAIDRLAGALGDRRPLFVIFGDEPEAKRGLTDHEHVLSEAGAIEDVFRMSRCHLIVGAASSYSTFAAIYGGTLAFHLHPHIAHALGEDGARAPATADFDAAVAWARGVDCAAANDVWPAS